MSPFNAQIEKRSGQNPLGLGLLLAGMASLGLLIVEANSRGLLHLRRTSGLMLLVGLLGLAAGLLWVGKPAGRVIVVVTLFGVSLFLDQAVDIVALIADIFPLPMPIWLLVALSPPLLGGYFVYRMQVPVVLQGAFALLGGYIQAVHIYNALHAAQHIGLFGGGWIS